MIINLFEFEKERRKTESMEEDERSEAGENMTDLWAENTVLKIRMMGLEASQSNS